MPFLLPLIAIGLATGVASGLLGVGGGFILIPLLSAIGVPLHAAIGASLFYVFFTSISGALRHLGQGTADARLGVPLMATSALTAVVGSVASARLPESALGGAFAFVTALALALFNAGRWRPLASDEAPEPSRWHVRRRRTAGGETHAYRYHLIGALATGALLGLVTGLLGIGGGFLLVPMLVSLLGIPLPIAIGSSLLSIVAAATAGIAAHWSLLGVDPGLVVPLVAAGVAGAQLGARLVVALPQARLRVAYNVLLIGATGYMLARVLGLAGLAAAAR